MMSHTFSLTGFNVVKISGNPQQTLDQRANVSKQSTSDVNRSESAVWRWWSGGFPAIARAPGRSSLGAVRGQAQ